MAHKIGKEDFNPGMLFSFCDITLMAVVKTSEYHRAVFTDLPVDNIMMRMAVLYVLNRRQPFFYTGIHTVRIDEPCSKMRIERQVIRIYRCRKTEGIGSG